LCFCTFSFPISPTHSLSQLYSFSLSRSFPYLSAYLPLSPLLTFSVFSTFLPPSFLLHSNLSISLSLSLLFLLSIPCIFMSEYYSPFFSGILSHTLADKKATMTFWWQLRHQKIRKKNQKYRNSFFLSALFGLWHLTSNFYYRLIWTLDRIQL